MRRCIYPGCNNKESSGLSLFKFPKDERRIIWLSNTAYMGKVNHSIRVCEFHFPSEYKLKSQRRTMLTGNAIPEKYVDDVEVTSNLSPEITIEDSIADNHNQRGASVEIDNTVLTVFREKNHKTYEGKHREMMAIPDVSEPISQCQFPSPQKRSYQSEASKEPPLKVPRYIFNSPRKAKGKEELEKLLGEKTEKVKTFVRTQLFHKKDQKWKKDERELNLSLFYKGPTSYRSMQRDGFVAPSTKTLAAWLGKMKYPVGPSDCLKQAVKKKVSTMSAMDKKCVLLFDEMYIKKELQYSEKDDMIHGFEDFGDKRKPEIANKVLVFMVVGLNSNWRQILTYYIGSLKGHELKEKILENVKLLKECGLNLKAIKSDQSTVTVRAMKLLGVSKDYPMIVHENSTIFCLYDVPHLFKNIRNRFLDSNIIFKGQEISWGVIRKVFLNDQNTVRMMSKISHTHVNPNPFEKQSVKLATQIFSSRVAAAIFSAKTIFKEHEYPIVEGTANFLWFMNNLFDNLNSRTKFSRNPNENSVSEVSGVLENLNAAKHWVDSLECVEKKRPPCFDGLSQTINGVLLLWEDLKGDAEQKYLLTGHLNQDPLENLFSRVRNDKGSYASNPSTFRVARILKQMCFNTNITTPENTTYENADHLKNLLEMDDIPISLNFKNGGTHVLDNTTNEDDDDKEENMLIPPNEEKEPSVVASMANAFFAGYLTKSFLKSISCQTCSNFIELGTPAKNCEYIIQREYKEGLLIKPTEWTTKFVEKVVKVFDPQFKSNCWKKGLRRYMLDVLRRTF